MFVPAGQAGTFAKQFTERGLDKAGIKLIGPGDIVDDNDLAGMGDAMLGVVTAGIYSDNYWLCGQWSSGWVSAVPSTATGPKNTKTATSPRPA